MYNMCKGDSVSSIAVRRRKNITTIWKILLVMTLLTNIISGTTTDAVKMDPEKNSQFIPNTKRNEKEVNRKTLEADVIEKVVRPYNNYDIETSTLSSYDFDTIVDINLLNAVKSTILDHNVEDYNDKSNSNNQKDINKPSSVFISNTQKQSKNVRKSFSNDDSDSKNNKENKKGSSETSTQNEEQIDSVTERIKTYVSDQTFTTKPSPEDAINNFEKNLDNADTKATDSSTASSILNAKTTKHTKLAKKRDYSRELDMDYQGDMPFERLPRIELLTNEVLSELNVKQILECKLPSNATMTAWYKNGKIMDMAAESSGNRLSVSRTGDAIITRVRKEDDGSWVCKGVDWLGNRISAEPISLIVLETPSVPTFEVAGRPINTSLPNRIVSAREGTELNATCSVLGGRPKPKISWTLRKPSSLPIPDSDGKDSNEELMVEEEDSDDGRVISVARMTIQRIHHNATLTCTMTHPTLATSLHSTVKVDVQYPPRFAISRVPGFGFPLAEGTPVSLRCEVESNPDSLPRWYKDDGDPPVPQTEDGFLNFTVLKREHSGWYKCTANHSFGVFSSIGYFLNVRYDVMEVTEEPDENEKPTSGQVEVALGGAVQLQCPTGSIGCWGRWSGSRWAGAGSEAPHGALSLRGLLYQQAGQYRCEGLSRGTQGRLQVLREHTILVTGGPTVFPSNRTVLANEGSSAHMSAEFCANPAPIRVMWIAGNRIYRMGDMQGSIVVHNATNSTSPDCWMAELTIVPVGLQHSGEYSLLIRNAKGSTEAIFMLAVTASRRVSKSESILNEWLRRSSSPSNFNIEKLSLFNIVIFWIINLMLRRIS